MAQTLGFVQSLFIAPQGACAQIGIGTAREIVTIFISSSEDASIIAYKTSMINALAAALAARTRVFVQHGDEDSIITFVNIFDEPRA